MFRKPEEPEPGEARPEGPASQAASHGQPALMRNVLEMVESALGSLDEVGSSTEEKPR